MDADVRRQIGELDGMAVAELREKWREVFGEETRGGQPALPGQATGLAAAGQRRGRPVRARPPARR